MRTIDRLAGVPLCHLAGSLERLRRIVSKRTIERIPRVILVTKFFGLGSIVLATPLLKTIKENFPHAKVVFLTFEENRELVERFPVVDVILTVRTSSMSKFLKDALHVLITLTRMRVDVSLDLEFFSKFSTLISSLAGSPVRVGFELPTRWRRRLLTHGVRIDRQKHVTEVFLSQLRVFGISAPQSCSPTLIVWPADIEAARSRVGLDSTRGHFVCVNVNTGEASPDRRWRKTKFSALVRRLADEFPGFHFYFTGNTRERAYVDEVIRLIPDHNGRFKNVAAVLSLGEFLGLLVQSDLLITNDSGPLHLASSAGVPTLSFFGPESPDFYGPLTGERKVFYEHTLCSPCLNVYQAKEFQCPYDQRCLERIQVDQVFEAAREILSKNSLERAVA